MRRLRHPRTGQIRRRARDSLFALLVGAVTLSTVLEFLLSHLQTSQPRDVVWWGGLVGAVLVGIGLVYGTAIWDDRRIGRDETRIELLLPYVVRGEGGQVELGRRRSYPATGEARAAWVAHLGQEKRGGAKQPRQSESGSLPFHRAILPEHMALVRHLLTVYLARFGRRTEPREGVHGFLRLEVPLMEVPWESLPSLVRDNPFSQAIGKAHPGKLLLPQGAELAAFDRGEVLLRLTWRPPEMGWHRLLCGLLGLGRYRPGGQVVVRWLGPLSAVRSYDRRYEHLTARLPQPGPEEEVWVLSTRLVVEVESRWNALDEVARFRDWGINLALYLQERMDYWAWRQYYLERTLDDLDWKIGWMAKGEEPGLAERLRRMDERLARLEEHLWPDEPPQGGGPGAWLSEEENDAAGSGGAAGGP